MRTLPDASVPQPEMLRPIALDPGEQPRSGAPGLMEAKLTPPRPRARTVRRTRLLRRVRVARDLRVLSIVAPAGYGKTSLLVQLARQAPDATAWLTADDGDNDPVVFLTNLASAIDRIVPVDAGVFDAIVSPHLSERAAVGRLLGAMSGRAEPSIVAIDDADRIIDRACLDGLAEFITYLPDGWQVMIAGRRPAGLPFPRWQIDGSMLEIGPRDLAMDETEASSLGRHLGLALEAETVSRLTRDTEGWPALLALAALEAIRSPRLDGGSDDRTEPTRGRHMTDYLRSEVLESRSGTEVEFLTRTSILERLSGPVCATVTGLSGSTDILAGLARSTLLIDEYGASYRYHSLLRDFLRAELAEREPDRVAELHRRAAAWYKADGALDLAVDHAFAAADPDLAANLAGQGMARYHWSGRRATVRSWFTRFDDEALGRQPWLAVLAAWEELAAGDVVATERLADIADRGKSEGRPPDGTASFESGRAMLRAVMVRRGAADALENATRAAELETAGSPWRDFALWTLATTRRTLGDEEGADAALADAVAAARSAGNDGLCYCLLGHRSLLAIERHDLTAGAAFAAEARSIGASRSVDGYLSSVLARAAAIRIAVDRGDIAAARAQLAGVVGLRPLLTAAAPALAVMSLMSLARAHLVVDDPGGARALLVQAGHVIRQRPDLGVLPDEVAALRTEVAARPFALGGATTLTTAELRVLALLPYYLSFKEIGQRLGTRSSTVKTHALSIYGKLGASSRSEAVDLAVQAGLLERFPR